MNFPPAPLSTSAGVSTVFPLWSRMVMGINNVFRSTRPNVTECISRQGETDVDPFSSLKTQVFSAFPKLLFFFCVQFSNHAPDMSVERVSFPFLFRGFHSFVFRCFFSLLVLREIVLFMVFCHMSCLSADEAFSIFHQLVSFFNAQGVDIHSVGILLSSEESSV